MLVMRMVSLADLLEYHFHLDVCAIKLGQIGNFLSNSFMVICNYLPRFIEKERFVDFNLLVSLNI
jgi:hypothetical protein